MLLAISTLKLAGIIFMSLLIMATFLFFALLLRGGSCVEDEEEHPGADFSIDYSERPYISKEQYN